MHARITGWGKYLPERVLTNEDLERMVDTSDDWIVTRTGIKERRIVADNEAASTMAVAAGRGALEVSPLSPDLLATLPFISGWRRPLTIHLRLPRTYTRQPQI